jgi:hypothetical protein
MALPPSEHSLAHSHHAFAHFSILSGPSPVTDRPTPTLVLGFTPRAQDPCRELSSKYPRIRSAPALGLVINVFCFALLPSYDW